LPGDHVTDDAGTGFVHTAPSHGDDDYQIGVKHGLSDDLQHPRRRVVPPRPAVLRRRSGSSDDNGKEADANKAVIDKLVEVGALLARGRITISDAHSWRSKAPVILPQPPQWFVAIDKPLGDGRTLWGRRSASGR
jgi:isoleucyl-tRNA synthetase